MNYGKVKIIFPALAGLFFITLNLIIKIVPTVNAQVVINEFSPVATIEWVEFYNSSGSGEYLKNYYLDDDTSFNEDKGSKSKKSLKELNAGNITYPVIDNLKSFFNNAGDHVVLFDGQGSIVDQYNYDNNPGSEVTFGRSPNNTGKFFILESSTKGSANAQPKSDVLPTPKVFPSLESSVEPAVSPSPTKVITSSPMVIKPTRAKSSPTLKPAEQQTLGEVIEASFSPVLNSSSSASESANISLAGGLLFIALGVIFSGVGGYLIYQKMQKG